MAVSVYTSLSYICETRPRGEKSQGVEFEPIEAGYHPVLFICVHWSLRHVSNKLSEINFQSNIEPRASLIVRASKQLRASQSLRAPVVLSGWEKVPFGASIGRWNVETRIKCRIFGTLLPYKCIVNGQKKKHFQRWCTHSLIILSKNDLGMTWNAIFSLFPGMIGMAWEWLKNDLKC